MLVLRSTLYWVWSILNTIVMAPFVLIGRIFSYDYAADMSHVWLRGNLWGLRFFCGMSWKVEGAEHIPDYPCLVFAKHQSTWETYLIPTLLPRSVYVAKKSLSYIPIFGWAVYVLRFILIDRSSGHSAVAQMIEQSKQRFAEGISVIVFPEGTRRPVGAEPNYRIGGGKIAEATGADVIPIALNAGEFWPRMGYIKWPGEMTLSIGPVIKTEGKAAADIMAQAEDWIESRMSEITVMDRFPY